MLYPWEQNQDTLTKFVEVSVADYDRARSQFMSAHLLDLFASSPRACQWKLSGLMPSSDRPALAFGRAAHTRILEGEEAYMARYEIADGPINPKTGNPYGCDTKAYLAWYQEVTEQGKEVISTRDHDLLGLMLDSITEAGLYETYLAAGAPEQAIRGRLCGVESQSRLDWFCVQGLGTSAILLDLKTCDDIDQMPKHIFWYGYDRQLAFYRMMAAGTGVCDKDRIQVRLLAIEKKEPYRCGVFRITRSTLDTAEAQVVKNLTSFKTIRETYGQTPWPRSLVYGLTEVEV